jgi:hypothetical protein
MNRMIVSVFLMMIFVTRSIDASQASTQPRDRYQERLENVEYRCESDGLLVRELKLRMVIDKRTRAEAIRQLRVKVNKVERSLEREEEVGLFCCLLQVVGAYASGCLSFDCVRRFFWS